MAKEPRDGVQVHKKQEVPREQGPRKEYPGRPESSKPELKTAITGS